MNKEKALNIISWLSLPIESAKIWNKQLALVKNWKEVDWYDPVYSIEVSDDGINIEWVSHTYHHYFIEFDNIVIYDWKN